METTSDGFEDNLHAWIDAHETELVTLVEKLVRYPSVSEPLDADAAHPFGDECARLADATKDIVEPLGLAWENHDYYAVSASYRGGGGTGASFADNAPASKPRPRIAFFSHLDVVPAGQTNAWRHSPFEPYAQGGYIYGRGSTDNKGPFASVLFALRFLKEQGIELDHDVVLYGGFNEEGAMDDVKWLAEHEPKPEVSLVSDCSFPVCVAEKSIVQLEARMHLDDPALLSFEAGEAHNIVPSRARAVVLEGGAKNSLEENGTPAHAAFPEGSVNALVLLAARLASNGNLAPHARKTFGFVAQAFAEYDGRGLGIYLHDDFLGDTTAVPTEARYEDGVLHLSVNIRYPDIAGSEQIPRRLRSAFEDAGFAIVELEENPGRAAPADDPRVELLTSIVNDELQASLEPYAMGGATHARWIPGALGFGPGRQDAPLPSGAGSGHQANEAVSIEHLKQAIAIYVRAILALDGRA